MTTLSEGRRTGEFLVSEAGGYRSRDQVRVLTDQPLPAGTVLGRVTASGVYAPLDPAAEDGSETATGILYANLAPAPDPQAATVIARDAEVNGHCLEWPGAATPEHRAAAVDDLAARGLIIR
ncbi:head decoration protein [Fodinicurvata sp. EGI_FJ10296]|uniref:head decoration protein n=1 Tax=Fodinicurvata sp. EGI_FJ10296 TaxID=3231908 RepID=UPI0034534808